MKVNIKLNGESLDEILNMIPQKYHYYYEDYTGDTRGYLKRSSRSLNCSDNSDKRMAIEFIKKEIVREATPEELEWIKKQPKVDIEEHPELKPILKWLLENIF